MLNRSISTVIAAAGALIIAASADRNLTCMALGACVFCAGMVLICTSHVCDQLAKVNRPADDAWTEGYEGGYDRGWRDGHAEARPTLHVITPLQDGKTVG